MVDTVEDKLIELLQSFGYPVIRQGSMAQDERYPETFITFWNNSETEHSAYDNNTSSAEYDYDVNIYSRFPDTAYELLRNVRDKLKENGWVCPDRGHDVPVDEVTHTGRGINVILLNK